MVFLPKPWSVHADLSAASASVNDRRRLAGMNTARQHTSKPEEKRLPPGASPPSQPTGYPHVQVRNSVAEQKSLQPATYSFSSTSSMTYNNSGDGWFVELTDQALDISKYTQLVTDPAAGAISSFIGTTRNNFQDRAVLRLEYEAYAPMAVAKMKELCQQVHHKWSVTKVAVAHRTGIVGVCEASVVIAVSSPHRKASLEATHWAIDELKATLPVWKKEFFEDGSMWKENEESRRRLLQQPWQQEQQQGAVL